MLERARWIAMLEAAAAACFWGASFIATKVVLREAAPATLVWLRFGLGVLILGALVAWRRQWAWISLNELGYFALIGFIGITFHQWLQANGLVTAQAITTAWILAAAPVSMAILAWLVLKEPLGWARAAGIGLATAGVLLVVSGGDVRALVGGKIGTPGDLLILISAPNWAVFSILSRRGLREHPPARMMLYVMFFGWLFTTPWWLLGPGLADLRHLTLPGWGGVLFLGVFCSGLAYIFWYDALHRITAAQAGAFLYIEPLVTMVTAVIVLSEPIRLAAVLGGMIILLGVWLVNRQAPPAAVVEPAS